MVFLAFKRKVVNFSLKYDSIGFYRIATFLCFLFVVSCKENSEKLNHNSLLPNIIWLVAEDQSAQFFAMYGDSTIVLPNLESLAKDGVTFLNAYATVPVCAPARSSIITGMYPTTLGTHNMRTYNAYAKANQPELGIPSYSPLVPNGTKMFTEYLRKAGYYCTNNSKEDYNFRSTLAAWDESSAEAHWRNNDKKTPFFSVFNFGICHESGIWKQGNEALFVSPDSVPIPPYFPDDPIIRKDLAVNYSNLKRLDDQLGIILKQLKEDGLYDNSIIFFYGDHGGPFPRHKRALYETGTKVPMLVKFQKNRNGGAVDERFMSFVDLAPTVLSMAGILPPPHMQGIALEGAFKAKKENRYIFTSSDRFDGQVDRIRAVRSQRYKYIKNFNPVISNALPIAYRTQMPMMQRLDMLYKNGELDSISSNWFIAPKPEEELYDLQEDPYELNNLAQNTILKDTLQKLQEVLYNWIKESKDLGKYPEKDLMENWFVNGIPKVQGLSLTETDKGVALTSDFHEASIVWRTPGDQKWQLYTEPLPKIRTFEAKAVHIGYEDSAVLIYQCEFCD